MLLDPVYTTTWRWYSVERAAAKSDLGQIHLAPSLHTHGVLPAASTPCCVCLSLNSTLSILHSHSLCLRLLPIDHRGEADGDHMLDVLDTLLPHEEAHERPFLSQP